MFYSGVWPIERTDLYATLEPVIPIDFVVVLFRVIRNSEFAQCIGTVAKGTAGEGNRAIIGLSILLGFVIGKDTRQNRLSFILWCSIGLFVIGVKLEGEFDAEGLEFKMPDTVPTLHAALHLGNIKPGR